MANKSVPVTLEMVEAGKNERMECFKTTTMLVGEALTRIYRAMFAAAPQPAPDAPASTIDLAQRRGRYADIIDEAVATYDSYMLNDDFDAQSCLDQIVARMRERMTAAPQAPTEALVERANRFLRDLPPHIAERETAKIIHAMSAALQSQAEQIAALRERLGQLADKWEMLADNEYATDHADELRAALAAKGESK